MWDHGNDRKESASFATGWMACQAAGGGKTAADCEQHLLDKNTQNSHLCMKMVVEVLPSVSGNVVG